MHWSYIFTVAVFIGFSLFVCLSVNLSVYVTVLCMCVYEQCCLVLNKCTYVCIIL